VSCRRSSMPLPSSLRSHSWPSMMSTLARSPVTPATPRSPCCAPAQLDETTCRRRTPWRTRLPEPLPTAGLQCRAPPTPHTSPCSAFPPPFVVQQSLISSALHSLPPPEQSLAARRDRRLHLARRGAPSSLGSPLNRFPTYHWSSPAGPRRSSLTGAPSAPRAPSAGAAAPWHRHHRPSQLQPKLSSGSSRRRGA
jgi:hypothetical protein